MEEAPLGHVARQSLIPESVPERKAQEPPK